MKRKELRKLIIVVSLVTVLAIVVPFLGGCFGKPAAAPPEEVEPIQVGAIFALTGFMAEDAISAKNGCLFGVDEINARGGVLGRPLELTIFDIGDFAPETLMLAADELVGVKGVDAVFGGWSGWGQDVRAFGRYDVLTFVFDNATTVTVALLEPGNDNVFHIGENTYAYAEWHWKYLNEMVPYEWPNKKVAKIGSDDAWGRETNEGMRQWCEEDGWEMVVEEIVPYGTTEWGPILAKIRATEPALISFEVAGATEAMSFFRQFMMDPTPSILDYGWTMSVVGFAREMGDEIDGLLGQLGGYLPAPPPTPETAAWLERYLAAYGTPYGDIRTHAATADITYSQVFLWARAVEEIGDPSNHEAVVQWFKDNAESVMPGMRSYDFVPPNLTMEADFQLPEAQMWGGQAYTFAHRVYGWPYVDYQGNSYEFQIPPWIEE